MTTELQNETFEDARAMTLNMIGQLKALINAREAQLQAELEDLLDQAMDQTGGTC